MRRAIGDSIVRQRAAAACGSWLVAACVGWSPTASADAIPKDDRQLVHELSQAVDAARRFSAQTPPFDAVFRRNPMQPLVNDKGEPMGMATSHDGPAVQGIIWSEEHPLVIIDDELMGKGAVMGPYTISEIRSDGVVVAYKGETLFIPLNGVTALPVARPASTVERESASIAELAPEGSASVEAPASPTSEPVTTEAPSTTTESTVSQPSEPVDQPATTEPVAQPAPTEAILPAAPLPSTPPAATTATKSAEPVAEHVARPAATNATASAVTPPAPGSPASTDAMKPSEPTKPRRVLKLGKPGDADYLSDILRPSSPKAPAAPTGSPHGDPAATR